MLTDMGKAAIQKPVYGRKSKMEARIFCNRAADSIICSHCCKEKDVLNTENANPSSVLSVRGSVRDVSKSM